MKPVKRSMRVLLYGIESIRFTKIISYTRGMTPPAEPLATGEVPLPHRGTSFVYRMYDKDGELLYVGVTDDLCRRVTGHRQTQRWWGQVARITWEQYKSRYAAERAEALLIIGLLPRYNVNGNHRRALADALGHKRPYDGAAWQRLGSVIRARREAMRRTQTSIAADAVVDLLEYRQLERGEHLKYTRKFLERVEAALAWRRGSLEAVLAGGEPVQLDAEELAARARGAHDRFHSIVAGG